MTFDDIVKNKPLHLQNLIVQLRKYIRSLDTTIEEHMYGWDKVKILLFHIGNKDNVLFGIQSTDKYAMLYLHHTDKIALDSLKLEGNGHHAKYLKISHPHEVRLEFFWPIFKKIIEEWKKAILPIPEKKKIETIKPSLKKITLENPKSIMRKKKAPQF